MLDDSRISFTEGLVTYQKSSLYGDDLRRVFMREIVRPLPDIITTESENERWHAIIQPFRTGRLTDEELAYFNELFGKICAFEETFYCNAIFDAAKEKSICS